MQYIQVLVLVSYFLFVSLSFCASSVFCISVQYIQVPVLVSYFLFVSLSFCASSVFCISVQYIQVPVLVSYFLFVSLSFCASSNELFGHIAMRSNDLSPHLIDISVGQWASAAGNVLLVAPDNDLPPADLCKHVIDADSTVPRDFVIVIKVSCQSSASISCSI